MKRTVLKGLIPVVALLSVAQSANAQSGPNNQLTTDQLLGQINTITTAVPFLIISPDSRSGGMGECGVASSPDVNSIHWNSAKLAFIDKKMGLGISYTPWLRALVPDINLAYLSFYTKVKKDQCFAGSLRYFSLGNITFTDVVGNTIGQFKPNEFAVDFSYARKLTDNFSASMTARYIYSNLTGGINVQGANTKAGQSFAVDLCGYYINNKVKVGDKKSDVSAGIAITNLGAKISYSNTAQKDFIPMNLRLGTGLNMHLDDFNQLAVMVDFNKLLVPTPPVYEVNPTTGQTVIDPNTGKPVILKGKDPDRSIASGIFGSFSDAPAGFKEELREINIAGGIEYWYDKQFAVRAGYFHEHPTKGNRQFFTLGAGIRYNVFGLDFAYLIPTEQRNPLENTLRFTLTFDFDAFKSQNKDAGSDSK